MTLCRVAIMAKAPVAGLAKTRLAPVLGESGAAALAARMLAHAVAEAAAALLLHDAVFVPAHDGGYALVGLRAAPGNWLQALFSGMVWSTAQVMAQTRQRLASVGIHHTELQAVADIDEPADLVHLPSHLQAPEMKLS